ncbi:hypothetical protein KIN20_028827 [Parelaphostrongylus tenuis]|uniref:Uncharacterized protein n=1 Tax=Parelaphostrongylus tenuis TaxID=148309 RepID=A0AAD5R1L4_PARTN|nr:hypothetical protein KIN20_028827 [Parelaphostrongylus tenuis]
MTATQVASDSFRTFAASGPSNLPVIAIYTNINAISTRVPGIATSAGAVQAFAQRFAMQTVVDVLEIEGRRALLPDFMISNILEIALESCIIVGNAVTGICPLEAGNVKKMCHEVARAIDAKHLSLSGTLTTTNIIMANWSRSMWQNIVDRALRMLRSDGER